jgi:site-specific DNA recombinase
MEQNIKSLKAIPKISRDKKVAAYARVSNGKDAMLHSLASQVNYYANLIQNHKGWSYVGVYVDEAVSGTNDKRTNFLRLIADCRLGKIDIVITKSISRFSRNTTTLLSTVRELKNLNVDVYFEEQKLHSLSGDGELMLSILASYAQEEARSVSENMRWRIRNNFKKGQVFSKTMLGYRIDHSKLVIVKEEASIVKRIFTLYLEGYGRARIAKTLNEDGVMSRKGRKFTPSSIFYMLRNSDYMGDLLLQKTFRANYYIKKPTLNRGQQDAYLVSEAHEAIIDKDTFEQAQREIARREKLYPHCRMRSEQLFSSLIRCGHCGSLYCRNLDHGKYRWRCSTYRHQGKGACPSKSIPEPELIRLTNEVLSIDKYDKKYLRDIVLAIVSHLDQTLAFNLMNGSHIIKHWNIASRKDSWTPQMRQNAALTTKTRHKERIKTNDKDKSNSSHH